MFPWSRNNRYLVCNVEPFCVSSYSCSIRLSILWLPWVQVLVCNIILSVIMVNLTALGWQLDSGCHDQWTTPKEATSRSGLVLYEPTGKGPDTPLFQAHRCLWVQSRATLSRETQDLNCSTHARVFPILMLILSVQLLHFSTRTHLVTCICILLSILGFPFAQK